MHVHETDDPRIGLDLQSLGFERDTSSRVGADLAPDRGTDRADSGLPMPTPLSWWLLRSRTNGVDGSSRQAAVTTDGSRGLTSFQGSRPNRTRPQRSQDRDMPLFSPPRVPSVCAKRAAHAHVAEKRQRPRPTPQTMAVATDTARAMAITFPTPTSPGAPSQTALNVAATAKSGMSNSQPSVA